jgi:hypothetical protein
MTRGPALQCKSCRRRRVQQDLTCRVKQAAIDAYGGRCICCGEERLIFLSIDHVHGDGRAHRERMREQHESRDIYVWLRNHGYPQDGRLQVLCHNCNMAKRTRSACPCQNPQTCMPEIKGQLNLF